MTFLLDNGPVNINAVNKHGNTALLGAIKEEKIEIVEELLSLNTTQSYTAEQLDVNIKDSDGYSGAILVKIFKYLP